MRGCEIGYRLAAAALLGLVLYSPAAPGEIVEEEERAALDGSDRRSARSPIELDDVEFGAGGSVSGVVVNRSADVLREVRLLVRYDWQWENERQPGDDSPARSTYVTVEGDIPALGTRPFRFAPSPPLPARDDGHYAPSIEVARYTQVRYRKVVKPR